MVVADSIAQWLADKGITHAFGVVGGGNNQIWDAITRLKKTELICTHHEQAATMASGYFNRIAGGLRSISLVTTGGGSTNAITGVAAASMDRIPLLVISGNEASIYIGAKARVWGTQGYDSCGVSEKITKDSGRLMHKASVIGELDVYLKAALTPPYGPVWVDIPLDIQRELV